MKIKNINTIVDYLIITLPLAYLLGSPFVNMALVIGSIIFLSNSIKYNKWDWLKITWVRLFIIFWFYLIMNSIFATDIFNALRGSLSLIRFLLFSLLISYYGFRVFSFKKVISFWQIILLIVMADIFFQFIFGFNIIGLPKHGVRFSGFFGNELIAGSYIFKFSAVIIGTLYYKIFFTPSNRTEYLGAVIFCLFSFFVCLITGERMSFILYGTLSIFLLIFILCFKKKFKYLLLFLITTILSLILIFNISNSIKSRYSEMTSILNNFNQSSYGKLFNSGYRLWQNNVIFGVGIKNFRVECDKQLEDILPSNPAQLCSTHPHNLYLELLSETGLVGTFIFITLFFVYFKGVLSQKIWDLKKKRNCIILSLIISSLLIIWPIGTSGSFFTTWNGSYLWIQIGILNHLLIRRKIII